MDLAADNHYPTMTLDGIRTLAVPAAEDAVLFLWATAPMLPEALAVIAAWGFSYRSRCVWVKDKIGTGYWFRDQAEELLVGVRGKIPAPAPGQQSASVVSAPVGEHSAKPVIFRRMIETMFPNLPRIELFARERIEGWDS
jgi:N6-adenosine-specific RNA methylase IME4